MTQHNSDDSKTPLPTEAPDDPHRLARIFMDEAAAQRRNVIFWRDSWWQYDGTKYRVVDPKELIAALTNCVRREFEGVAMVRLRAAGKDGEKISVQKVTRSLIANVTLALEALTIVPGIIDQPVYLWENSPRYEYSFLAMQNGLVNYKGLLDGETLVLHPHSPQWFSPICLNFAYDPKATCPRWEDFLGEVFEGDQDRIHLLREWFGYCLTPDTSLQKFLIMQGEGANGKTVVLRVLIALLGEDNVSHVPVELFAEPFQLTATLCKLGNIVSEVGGVMDRVTEGKLKAFTAGDAMHFDRKHLTPLQARPTARLIVAANEVPPTNDRSLGLIRRMSLLVFRVSIPADQQDPKLGDKLLAELPGILLWAVEGRRRLQRQGQFTEPAICVAAREEYRHENNPIRAYFEEHLEINPDGFVFCSDLIQSVQMDVCDRGFPRPNEAQIGKELKRFASRVERRKGPARPDGSRPYVYFGVAFESSSRPATLKPAPSRPATPAAPIPVLRKLAKSK
jgi:putative DNA primase/helicase